MNVQHRHKIVIGCAARKFFKLENETLKGNCYPWSFADTLQFQIVWQSNPAQAFTQQKSNRQKRFTLISRSLWIQMFALENLTFRVKNSTVLSNELAWQLLSNLRYNESNKTFTCKGQCIRTKFSKACLFINLPQRGPINASNSVQTVRKSPNKCGLNC